MKKTIQTRLWDYACAFDVIRKPPKHPFFEAEKIDPGANYFVLMLEQLGAVPHFSCEGHPNGFYVVFEAPMALANRVRACGYFSVELEGRNKWSIRTRYDLNDEATRKSVLRGAAESWHQNLGRLTCIPESVAAYLPPPNNKTTKCKR